MRTIIAVPGQSVFDIALLYCGDATLAYTIATLNTIDITLTFTTATSILIPDDTNNIAKNFATQNIMFASGDENNYWYGSDVWNDVMIWNDKYNK